MSHHIIMLKVMRFPMRLSILTMSLGLITSHAWAATAPDAGQTLQQLQAPRAPVALTSPATTLSNEATSDVRGSSVGGDTRVQVTQLRFRGNTVYDSAFLNHIVGKLGKDLNLNDLRAATHRISQYYRQHGYLLARAYLPEQDISNGTVTIAILEGRLDHITVNNQSKLSTKQLQALLDTQQPSNQPVRSDYANRGLLLTQALPGVGTVQGSLRPSAVVGSTDLTVDVTAGPRITGYVGLDNSGNRFTGADRLSSGVNLNNVLGIGDQLSVQGVLTNQDQMDYGRVAWDAPIASQGVRVGAAFSNLRYQLGEDFASLDAHGIARTASLYSSLMLIATPDSHMNLNVSLERRELTDVTGAIALDNKRSLNAAVLTVSGDFKDSLLFSPAVNAWRVTNTAGLLDLNTASVSVIDSVTAQTAGHYDKVVFSATREQVLPANLSLYVSGMAQRSDRNLDSSEQMSLGGANGIRAYPEGEATGDQGWLGSVELRYRLMPNLQLLGFYDAGGVEANRNPYINRKNNTRLSGSGIGANASWGAFSLKTSVAWRAGSAPPTSDTDRRPRAWVQGSYAF